MAGALLWLGVALLVAGVCLGQKPLNFAAKRRDLYIAGLFPYARHVPEGAIGRGVMPSVDLAIQHINENPSYLRNFRLHMWANDTQCNAAVGVKAFFDMMHSGPHKMMLFGAACTQVTDPIAKASKHWRLTQLSYADTHPMFTMDSFPNFFRIVPSENAFNAPRLTLLNQFNWTRVGTIYQNEPRYALAHNRLISDLDQNDIEVVESQSFATEVTTALEKLKQKDVRIILGNFNEVWAMKIFCEAYRLRMFGRKYQWVIVGMYTENWWLGPDIGCVPLEMQEALHGTILTDLLPLSTERQITVSGITPDEYLESYNAKRGSEYSRFHGYTYDGIWAVALAIQHVSRRIRSFRRNQTIVDFRYRDDIWEKLFLEALRNTSFEGVTGPVRFYDNERKAYILLKQFQSGSEVKVGEYDAITGILDLARGQPLVWRGKSPPKDRTVHIIEHTTVNITIYAVLATTASLGIIMAAVFLAINIKFRNQRYIKMSSPHLNNLIIIGCMLTYSSVIFLGLDSQLTSVSAFRHICTARAWLLMAGFSLAFGSMFSKTWRVHSIFTDVKLNKKVIKDYQLFMVVGILVVIDLAIMTTWQVADPFYRETKQMEPYPHPSSEDIIILPENEYCQSNRMTVYLGSIYAYKGLLMIFGAFLAWETRHVSIPALNDSKYVGMSVYNVVIMCIMGAAISFVLADKQDAMFIMLSVFIIFCSTATLCLVFVPKLIELRRNPQGQIDKRFRPTLRPSKTRRDSTASELEDRVRDITLANQKFRKQLHEMDSELQMYLRRLADDDFSDTQTAMDRLTVPRPDSSIKREGPSVTTETTDISISMCSLNSGANISQLEGDYVNVNSIEQQTAKKKTSFSRTLVVQTEGGSAAPTATTTGTSVTLPSALKQPGSESGRRRARVSTADETQQQQQQTHSLRHEDDERQRLQDKRARLPTPPPPKNVSFGELREDEMEQQQQQQCGSRHRHAGTSTTSIISEQQPSSTLKRRSSAKGLEIHQTQRELLERRRTSVPASYIAPSEHSRDDEGSPERGQTYSVAHPSECVHRRATLASTGSFTGYRCEKHGGAPRPHALTNGSATGALASHHEHQHQQITPATASRGSRGHLHHTAEPSRNASNPSVATPYPEHDKLDSELVSSSMQRSVSERSRGGATGVTSTSTSTRCSGPRHAHTLSECPHRRGPSRAPRESCPRHSGLHQLESRLRQQASRLEYVQSTPNVATVHQQQRLQQLHRQQREQQQQREAGVGGSGTMGSSGLCSVGPGGLKPRSVGSNANVYSAVSDGELLDVAILPIFQKLLTERHKGAASRYGASVASCPNISIKCDIVEYL